jgi:hypothetical protein
MKEDDQISDSCSSCPALNLRHRLEKSTVPAMMSPSTAFATFASSVGGSPQTEFKAANCIAVVRASVIKEDGVLGRLAAMLGPR